LPVTAGGAGSWGVAVAAPAGPGVGEGPLVEVGPVVGLSVIFASGDLDASAVLSGARVPVGAVVTCPPGGAVDPGGAAGCGAVGWDGAVVAVGGAGVAVGATGAVTCATNAVNTKFPATSVVTTHCPWYDPGVAKVCERFCPAQNADPSPQSSTAIGELLPSPHSSRVESKAPLTSTTPPMMVKVTRSGAGPCAYRPWASAGSER